MSSIGIIVAIGSVNERYHYNVASSLIGWAHTQNNPCFTGYNFICLCHLRVEKWYKKNATIFLYLLKITEHMDAADILNSLNYVFLNTINNIWFPFLQNILTIHRQKYYKSRITFLWFMIWCYITPARIHSLLKQAIKYLMASLVLLSLVKVRHRRVIIWINSFPPSGAYMHQWTGSVMVEIMACRLCGAKPLSKPMLGHCQLDP